MKRTTRLIYLFVSILVSLSMIFLDPIAVATSEETAGIMMYLILFGMLVTVVYSIMFIFKKLKRNGITVTAFIITSLNLAIILLLLLFGALLV